MVKGCERRVVYLKNTDSMVFEEAFFVMKDAKTEKPPSSTEMVREANRILSENMTVEGMLREPSSPSLSLKQACLSFLSGVVFSSGIFLLFSCLI
jgi:hypothetical protein